MRLLAGVLHSDEIVWNSYTWDADARKQRNTKTQGLPLKMAIGSCNVDCKTYDSFLKAYVGGATIDTLSNFVNGCIVVPIQARTQFYEPGVVSITVNSDNWIRVQCGVETVAEVCCLIISKSN